MSATDREQQLERLRRALGSADLADVFERYRAVVGPPAEEMSELAQAALATMDTGRDPNPEQLQALELAIRLHRPAPLVQHGAVGALDPDAAPAFPGWPEFCRAVAPFLGSVGRIDRVGDASYTSSIVGTGFLVGPTTLATNHHVVDVLTLGTDRIAPGQAVVKFGQEFGVLPDPPEVPVVAVRAVHSELDLALLTIEADGPPVPPLVPRTTAAEVGAPIAAIGYPDKDDRNPRFVDLLFGTRLGVKRAAPGEVTHTRVGSFNHDCTTLGGNSGSPIVSQDDAALIGVHADGYFLARNSALTGPEVQEFLAAGAGMP